MGSQDAGGTPAPELTPDTSNAAAAALWTLALGNFATATGVLMPAAMLQDVARSFGLSSGAAGYLLVLSGLVIGLGAPVLAGLTSRMDRRSLLAAALLIGAAGHVASALSTSFPALMTARVAIAAAAAVFGPQAAATVTVLVPPARRDASIAFIFIGWSLAMIIGLPASGLITADFGWQAAHMLMSAVCGASAALLWSALPAGRHTEPVSLGAWRAAAGNPVILLLLLVTFLSLAGQFTIFSFLSPLLAQLFGADARETAVTFAVAGLAGVAGNILFASLASYQGSGRLVAVTLTLMATGAAILAFSGGSFGVALLSVAIWGLGSFASTSLQQGRLANASPDLAAATISLNTSTVYLGQAAGVAAGGIAIGSGRPQLVVWIAIAFLLAAIAVSAFVTRRAGGERRSA